MKAKRKSKSKVTSRKISANRLAHEAEGGVSVALVGAAVGAVAGPPGMVAGAILGGVAGALTGAALDADSSRRAARSLELDEAIGVSGGELGAPDLAHPPARVGASSAASAGGASGSGPVPAEGPLPPPEE